jgi:hypothetical protein
MLHLFDIGCWLSRIMPRSPCLDKDMPANGRHPPVNALASALEPGRARGTIQGRDLPWQVSHIH